MPRLLIMLGLAAVAVVVLLLATDLIQLGGPLEADPDAPLDWEEPESLAPHQPDAPTLSAATAEKAKRAARQAAAPEGTDPDGPTGPYDISVIDAETEAPLEDVVILDGAGESLGKTDEDGMWSLADAGVVRLSFVARKDGYVIHRGIATPDRPLEVVLHGGIAITGIVVRAGSDVGIAGASIRAWDTDFGREVAATSTDAKGHFKLHAVRPHHPVTLITSAPGLTPDVRREVFGTVAPADYLIRVGSGGRLDGRVFDTRGKPAKGMTVWLMPKERHPYTERGRARAESGRRRVGPAEILQARTAVTQTDDEGRYVFEGVPIVDAWVPAAFPAPRHIVRGSSVRFVADGEERTIDITLVASATLQLSVKDALGKTMSHADIRLRSGEGHFEVAATDHWESGVLTIEGLTPGALLVSATLPGRPAQGASVKLLDGATTRADLVFNAGGELVGTVKDEAGRAIWQALVTWRVKTPAERVEVRTDERGRFHLRGLRGIEGALQVSARDLPHTRRTYESWENLYARPGEGKIPVTLKKGTSVIATFPDLPKGTSLNSSMLAAKNSSDWPLRVDAKHGIRRDGPDADRSASFAFYLRGHPPLIIHERSPFGSGETRDLGTLAFEKVNPRKGRVLGPDRKPIHGAKVTVNERWSKRSTRTDTDGDFVLAHLPDQRIRLRIEAPGLPPANLYLQTTSQFRRQTFVLSAGRRVNVEVLLPSGKPAAACHVVAQGDLSHWKTGDPMPVQVRKQTNARGQLVLWLPDGLYTFTALADTDPAQIATTPVQVAASASKRKRRRRNAPVSVRMKLRAAPR